MYFVFIYWFCWLIVLICFVGFTFSSSYFHNIFYVRWPVVICDTWTVSNIKSLHYLRLSESSEKLTNRKKRWKCKIKYLSNSEFPLSLWMSLAALSASLVHRSHEKAYNILCPPSHHTTKPHQSTWMLFTNRSIVFYWFEIFIQDFVYFFYPLPFSSFSFNSYRWKCETLASLLLRCVSLTFIQTIQMLLHCQENNHQPRFQSHAELFISIVGYLFVCFVTHFTNNTEIILCHYNKMLSDNTHRMNLACNYNERKY